MRDVFSTFSPNKGSLFYMERPTHVPSYVLFKLTSSCGDAESSLTERYITMCGMCPMDIWSSAVSSPHSKRTSWLTGGEAFVLRTDEVSLTLPPSTRATVSMVSLTWRWQEERRKIKNHKKWRMGHTVGRRLIYKRKTWFDNSNSVYQSHSEFSFISKNKPLWLHMIRLGKKF